MLKPCPFCGSKNEPGEIVLIAYEERGPDQICVCCWSCGARGSKEQSKYVARLAWNNRGVEKYDE
jgi:hypothetical protein